jgi:hypothetical protein
MAVIEDLGGRFTSDHDPSKTYTLTDYIKNGKQDELTYNTFSILRSVNSITFSEQCITDYYMEDLKKQCDTIKEITEEEKARYKYRPDLLSYDLYGSVQLDFIILLCNGIIDPKEFDFKRGYLRLISRLKLKRIMNEIYNSEYDWIKINRNALKAYDTTDTRSKYSL